MASSPERQKTLRPPLDEQRRIVARVEEQLSAVEALRAAIERAQRRSASLRRAVLERAFRGELVPQDPADEPADLLLARIRTERDQATPTTRHGRARK
jgi:type I restriction enzyme S subunit